MTWRNADLTRWFDGAVHKPVRPGVYMLKCGLGQMIGYQHWDGRRWGRWSPDIAEVLPARNGVAAWSTQTDKWRGLRKRCEAAGEQ